MTMRQRIPPVQYAPLAKLTPLAVPFLLACSAPAQAFEFERGELTGSLDTTLSYGARWRVQDADKDTIGIAAGGPACTTPGGGIAPPGTGCLESGRAYSVNADDGNQNYDKGLVSGVFKATTELELNYGNFGAFLRGTAFFDHVNENESREKFKLTDKALDLVGSDARILDAYISANFTVGDMPAQVRLGDQVISWGESTFIQNSINTINPVDVSAIRVPGAELREALVPEGLVWGSLATSENTAVEAFYLYDWEETEIDPPGSYFSTNDFVGDGGSRVMLGFGGFPEGDFLGVPRDPTRKADNDGQFGVALRWFLPQLNDTELGFYYVNYHSRVPVISSRTGTLAGAGTAGAIGAPAGSGGATDIVGATILSGGNPAAGVAAAGPGVPLTAATAIAGATAATLAATSSPAAAQAAGSQTATAYATDAFASTAAYLTEYPEDIQLLGVSFNTELRASGIALQGEFSHRLDAPLQVDDVELLFATLGPINPGLAAFNQVGNYTGQFNTYIPGFITRDVSQLQMTASKIFSRVLGADRLLVLGEVAVTHVHDMPDKDELRLNGPGTFISGNRSLAGAHTPTAAGKYEKAEHFADATSWGYRLVGRLDYSNVIGAINLAPRIAWQHDVNGITPQPIGNFLEGRTAVTLGVEATYQNQWSADLSYTRYAGAGRYNLINDRDFIAASLKYSF